MTVRVRVIPCLDVRDGRVVKGVNFVDLKDAGDPVEQAQAYDAAGADELCFLDISASHEGRGTLLDMVRRTAEVCFMPLTVGGGVRSVEDARALLLAGADKVAVNSAAVTRPELVREIAEKFGSQCVVASVDARASTSGEVRGWEIYTHGGRKPTGIDAVEHAVRLAELGAGELLVTSMDGDGTKAGYDVDLTRVIADAALDGSYDDRISYPATIGALSWAEFAALTGQAIGRTVRVLPMPVPILKSVASVTSLSSRLFGLGHLTLGKLREFRHPDWTSADEVVNPTPMIEALRETARSYGKT